MSFSDTKRVWAEGETSSLHVVFISVLPFRTLNCVISGKGWKGHVKQYYKKQRGNFNPGLWYRLFVVRGKANQIIKPRDEQKQHATQIYMELEREVKCLAKWQQGPVKGINWMKVVSEQSKNSQQQSVENSHMKGNDRAMFMLLEKLSSLDTVQC